MKPKMKKSTLVRILCIITMIGLIIGMFPAGAVNILDDGSDSENTNVLAIDLTYYYEVYANYDLAKKYDSEVVNIDLQSAVKEDGTAPKFTDVLNKTALLWDDIKLDYNFNFDCNEGLYYIEFEYAPLVDTATDIIRSVLIDNESAFTEAEHIKFSRLWIPYGDNYFDLYGDERAAQLIQKQEFATYQARDLDGLYSEPLLFYLGNGNHTLTLQYVSGTVAFSSIKLVPYSENISYEKYLEKNKGVKFTGEPITVEGEEVDLRNSRIVTGESIRDTTMTPFDYNHNLINTIGGWNWRNGNDYLTWNINVPEDGLYKLALRVAQDYNGLVIYRQIKIDGKVPFKEVTAYPFYAHDGYETITVGENSPYLFYFTKGEHSVTLSAVAGENEKLINRLMEISRNASALERQIRVITGADPDPNFDYELAKKMPGLLDSLKSISDDINEQSEFLKAICKGKTPNNYGVLKSSVETLGVMIKNSRSIPVRLEDLNQIQSDLADTAKWLKAMPVAIDYIQLLNPDEKIVQKKSNILQNLKLVFVDFYLSFVKDYTSIQYIEGEGEDTQVLKVMVARGRDWGETIQRLANEEFTPKTNIKVSVNILPIGSTSVLNVASPLMLSVVADKAPDVAMGSDNISPLELAFRGQAVSLNQFDGFEDVASRFAPANLIPISFNGKTFALPETMDIPLLVYRKDILSANGIKVPETWDELWKYTIPKLKQINANFFLGTTYETFLFQNGGEYYSQDGKKSALNTDAAFNAFFAYTKNFTEFQSPQAADVYNEIRVGTIPIAVGNTGTYLQLDVAAPELYGRFEIAPIPGTADADGNILRYGSGTISTAFILKDSKKKDDAWEFLKWWTDGATQERFASEMEARMGPEARWFSANTDAFLALPWGKERKQIVEDWLKKWYKNPTYTLGGYYTSRSMTNAFTRTVMLRMKARDQLEQAYEEISLELERKQQIYGVNWNDIG